MKILILGASGMLGNAMLRVLSKQSDWDTFGTIRNYDVKCFFSSSIVDRLLVCDDIGNIDNLMRIFNQIRPSVVINCVGLIKHKPDVQSPLATILINTLMPHRLADMCKLTGARLIHISTDCVFSGKKGGYVEDDFPDPHDLYGQSKALGEVIYPHTITLRTSAIGHELQSKYGLLDWFLSQNEQCKGYARATFSGLPTVVLAEIVRDIVLPRPDLFGLYHVGAKPINKFELLMLIANIYGKDINITKDTSFVIDRSLDSTRFQMATGYVAPEWHELIRLMHVHQYKD